MLSYDWVGAHATPGPCHRRRRGSAKEASMWVSWMMARQMVVGLTLVALSFIGLEVSLSRLPALFLD